MERSSSLPAVRPPITRTVPCSNAITGNTGLGEESIRVLSQHNPTKIYLAARTESKARKAIGEIVTANPAAKDKLEFLQLDLADLSSVQNAARTFVAKEQRLDILMLNAGIMAVPNGLTKDGYEIQFGTNHVGHALLTKLLMPTLLKTQEQPSADVRIIVLSSTGHQYTPTGGLVLDEVKTDMAKHTTWARYGHSKLSNLFFASQLAKRYPQILTVSLHPGMVDSQLYDPFLGNMWVVRKVRDLGLFLLRGIYIRVDEGAKNQLWASTAPREQIHNGGYYDPVGKEGRRSANSRNDQLGEKLWDWTENELQTYNL